MLQSKEASATRLAWAEQYVGEIEKDRTFVRQTSCSTQDVEFRDVDDRQHWAFDAEQSRYGFEHEHMEASMEAGNLDVDGGRQSPFESDGDEADEPAPGLCMPWATQTAGQISYAGGRLRHRSDRDGGRQSPFTSSDEEYDYDSCSGPYESWMETRRLRGLKRHAAFPEAFDGTVLKLPRTKAWAGQNAQQKGVNGKGRARARSDSPTREQRILTGASACKQNESPPMKRFAPLSTEIAPPYICDRGLPFIHGR
mmetsp:Transcript_48241/g.87132  ORF Transcript_48241/g.87132 Transcript_48241/m.87132 type:complete len:254 (-) Transcript_48241:6-767(-)